MRPQTRKFLAKGISQKISPPLVSKPQISALARWLCWMCKKKERKGVGGLEDEKEWRKQWAAMQIKCRFCVYDFYVTNERRKDEKWREINIIGLARPLVSFGGLELSTITARSLPWNPESGKRKPGLSFLFFPSLHPLSPSHCLHPIPLSLLSGFLIVSFPCPFAHSFLFVLSIMCSPLGNLKVILIHLLALKGPPHSAEWDYLSVFEGWNKKSTAAVRLDKGEKCKCTTLKNVGLVFMRHFAGQWWNMKNIITKTWSAVRRERNCSGFWSCYSYYSSWNSFLSGGNVEPHVSPCRSVASGFYCSVNSEGKKMVKATHEGNPKSFSTWIKNVCAGKLSKPGASLTAQWTAARSEEEDGAEGGGWEWGWSMHRVKRERELAVVYKMEKQRKTANAK